MKKQTNSIPLEIRDKYVNRFFLLLIIVGFMLIINEFICNRKNNKLQYVNSKVVITGHKKLSKEEIVEILQLKPDVSLDVYDTSKLEAKLKKNLRVSNVSIARRSNDKLLVTVEEKDAKFVIHIGEKLFEVDEELNIISINDVRDSGICIISGKFNISNNKIENAQLKDLVETLERTFKVFPTLKERISEVVLNPDGEISIYIFNPRRLTVLVGEHLSMKQVRKLYTALAYFETQRLDVRLLDLRGDDAVYH